MGGRHGRVPRSFADPTVCCLQALERSHLAVLLWPLRGLCCTRRGRSHRCREGDFEQTTREAPQTERTWRPTGACVAKLNANSIYLLVCLLENVPSTVLHIHRLQGSDPQISATVISGFLRCSTGKCHPALCLHARRVRSKECYARGGEDRKSTRLNSSHSGESRMPSSA